MLLPCIRHVYLCMCTQDPCWACKPIGHVHLVLQAILALYNERSSLPPPRLGCAVFPIFLYIFTWYQGNLNPPSLAAMVGPHVSGPARPLTGGARVSVSPGIWCGWVDPVWIRLVWALVCGQNRGRGGGFGEARQRRRRSFSFLGRQRSHPSPPLFPLLCLPLLPGMAVAERHGDGIGLVRR